MADYNLDKKQFVEPTQQVSGQKHFLGKARNLLTIDMFNTFLSVRTTSVIRRARSTTFSTCWTRVIFTTQLLWRRIWRIISENNILRELRVREY